MVEIKPPNSGEIQGSTVFLAGIMKNDIKCQKSKSRINRTY